MSRRHSAFAQVLAFHQQEDNYVDGYQDFLNADPDEFLDDPKLWTPNEIAEEEKQDRERIRGANAAKVEHGKPDIVVKANNLPDILRQIDDSLLKLGAPIYQRGGALVRIGETSITKNKSGLEFVNIVSEDLVVLLSRYITWMRYDGRQKQMVNT